MVPPSVQPLLHAIGNAGHDRCVRGNPFAVKGGLHQPPLAQMRVAFARQQPVAEQTLRALEPSSLEEALLIGDQHVLDELRIVQQEQMLAGHMDVTDVAVGPCQVR